MKKNKLEELENLIKKRQGVLANTPSRELDRYMFVLGMREAFAEVQNLIIDLKTSKN